MRYQKRRRLYSQNFLCSPKLVDKLIRKSSIGVKDIVLEIGPGRGIITSKLLKFSKLVIAIEKDKKLYQKMLTTFSSSSKLCLFNADYLTFCLLDRPYKVFANLPFSITADIMRKLTDDVNFIEGFLVMQKEAAKKFMGMPYAYKNSMMSVVLKPWFETDIFWRFNRNDFVPEPAVDVVMLRIKRKINPDIKPLDKVLYKAFVAVLFNKEKVARKDFRQILKRFFIFKKYATRLQRINIFANAQKIEKAASKIEKIKRSRKSKNWRDFINKTTAE